MRKIESAVPISYTGSTSHWSAASTTANSNHRGSLVNHEAGAGSPQRGPVDGRTGSGMGERDDETLYGVKRLSTRPPRLLLLLLLPAAGPS